jgi:hypothetical protein
LTRRDIEVGSQVEGPGARGRSAARAMCPVRIGLIRVVGPDLEEGDMAKAKKKLPKLGTGERFKKVAAAAKASGARDPDAVAAAVGRKRYGAKKMAKLSARGRKRASKRRRLGCGSV